VRKHHAHTVKHFLSVKKELGLEYYIAGESDSFYLKPNEILTKEKTYFLFQEFLDFNVTCEIFDFATNYQMAFSVV
jgi:hypothetical protein